MTHAQVTTAPHPSLGRYLCEPPQSSDSLLYSELENHVLLGDAVEVLASLPSGCVDLVHTSPPYNIDKPYESSAPDRGPLEEYLLFLRRAIAELRRVVRPGGSVFWQTGYTQNGGDSREIIPIDLLSYEIFRDEPNRFLLWDRIIWRYWGGHAFTKKFTNKHETIMWYVKPGAEPVFRADAVRERAKEYDKRNNFWGRNPGNVWEVDRVAFGATEQTSHIAVFPEEITERIVRACSEPGGLVLDPFAGSGTVPKVAHGLGRRWLGIEISPLYAAEAAVRVGFQQPSESDSLASELIKHIGFNSRKGVASIAAIGQRLNRWARQVDIPHARTAFDDDVSAVFADGNGRNLVKREVWSKYDALLLYATTPNTPVALADRLLCSCYKLRQHFNGVTRYRSALAALDEVVASVVTGEPDSFIKRIAEQEPSSFEVVGDRLALQTEQRSVTAQTKITDVAEERANGEHTETSQGKLML